MFLKINGVDPFVTLVSKVLIIIFIISCAIYPAIMAQGITALSNLILYGFKWFYILLTTAVLLFLIYLMGSRHGNLVLGDEGVKPEFSLIAWLSMLFSAGMGIGLLFWSVAEPVLHYGGNPFALDGFSDASTNTALRLSFYHWGLHPWGLFILTALGLSYVSYRKKLPLTIHSVLIPLFGSERISGWLGRTIDLIVVSMTAFGIASSLGLGVSQMCSGLEKLFDWHLTKTDKTIMIIIVSALSIISVVSGVRRGIKLVSFGNMILSLVILSMVLVFGPSRYVIHTFLQGTSDYAQNIVGLSLWSDAQADSQWQNSWTAYYWAWWLTWAPFVGMFIARISRGRTIKQLIMGALIAPTFFCFFWISTLGGSALKYELDDHKIFNESQILNKVDGQQQKIALVFSGGDIYQATKKEPTKAIFTLYDKVEASSFAGISIVLTAITSILLVTYFVTSADSGMLVLATLSSYGNPNPPQICRIIWGLMICGIAAALLWVGGLKTVQTATICAGLPVSVLIVLMMFSIAKALRSE